MSLNQTKKVLPLWFSCLVVLGGIPTFSFAQFGVIWEKAWGGSVWEEQNGVVPLYEHNAYVFGGFSSSNGSHEVQSSSEGNGDCWLVWTDTTGVIIQETLYGGSGKDRIHNTIVDNDGNIVFVASTESPMNGDLTSESQGASDIWVVKVQTDITNGVPGPNNGKILAQKRLGTERCEEGGSITVTPDGRFLVVGESHQTDNCFVFPYPPSEIWASLLDANLNEISRRIYSGGEKNKPTSVVCTPDGGFIIAGETWPSLDYDSPDYAGSQWFYFKIDDASGVLSDTPIWEKTKGGGNQDAILDIIPTIDDAYLIIGFTDAGEPVGNLNIGLGDVDSLGFGREDMLLMKVDQEGNEIWEKRYGGELLDWGYSAVQNQLGNYIVIGVSQSNAFGTKTSPNKGANDFWVLHLDSDGNVLWDQSFGGEDIDSCTKIAHAIGGGYIIGGHSTSGIGDDKSDFNRGFNDQWVIRTGCQIFSPELPDIDFICEGEELEIDATVSPCTGCIYTWEDGSTDPVRAITADQDFTEFSLFITHKDACQVFDTFTMEVTPNPTAIFLEVDSVTCYGSNDGAIYIDGIDGGTAPFTFDINGEIFQTIADLPTFQNLESGFFDISVEDAKGCKTDTTILIEHPEEPFVVLPDDIEAELGDSFKIQALVTPNIVSWQWLNPDELSCTDCLEPYISPKETTSVGIIVKDKNGCTAQDGVTIFITKDGGVYVPNVFTPNGDGDNDYLAVFAKNNIKEVTDFSIFDRWGNQMFTRQNFPPNQVYLGWDGTFRGKNAARAVYVYTLTVERKDGIFETYTGDFTIMK